MAQKCGNPYCERELCTNYKGTTNHVHPKYCTLYCKEAVIKGMRPLKSSSPHGKKYQPIKRECTVCRRDYTITHDERKGNQRFCSRDCHRVVTSYKKGHRDFLLLTILHEGGSMTSHDLARITTKFWKSATQRSIGLIMKAWIGRGIISAVRPQPKRPYTYTFESELYPGELIMKYCRKK